MIYPKFLKKGDCIGVPAPSGGAYDELHKIKYKNSKLKLEQMGYKCVLSENINKSEKARSAPAKIRAEEINKMFEDESIDFIMCAAGGEFLVEILPYISFEKILSNPKFVQGFSDPTGLLFPLTTKYDVATIYANNFGEYGVSEYDRSVIENLQILQGDLVTQKSYEMYENESVEGTTGLEGYNFTDKVEWKVLNDNGEKVSINGRIIGGTFDVILNLIGTKYDGTKQFIEKYKDDGIIWYFDNYELSKEEIICALWRMNEFDYFKYVKGFIFGRNGVEKSVLGYTMKETLEDSVIGSLNVPIIFDADISHKGPCLTIINGAIATIESEGGNGSIEFELR